MSIRQVSQKNTSEIEFRISFRADYGIDYLDAEKKIKDMRQETARRWNEVLIKNKII